MVPHPGFPLGPHYLAWPPRCPHVGIRLRTETSEPLTPHHRPGSASAHLKPVIRVHGELGGEFVTVYDDEIYTLLEQLEL